jgi:hypothetical protein
MLPNNTTADLRHKNQQAAPSRVQSHGHYCWQKYGPTASLTHFVTTITTATLTIFPPLSPQLGASIGAPRRSAAAHPTPRLPAYPHRVDGSQLAGVPASSTPPANVAPTWATIRAGSSDSSPSIFDFMSLYDICVATSHAARVSVSHCTGYQDVTLFCRLPHLSPLSWTSSPWLPLSPSPSPSSPRSSRLPQHFHLRLAA